MIYYTPQGEDVSTLATRIQAVGVALLFAYSVSYFLKIQMNDICQALITFVLNK